MADRQFSSPVILRSGRPVALKRLEFQDDFHDENWIQRILFEQPSLIPFEELEPAFGGSVPLGREVTTAAGPIDLLYVTSDGLLTIVETKLWRNPEARRKVIAQLFDYAARLAKLSFDELNEAVARSTEGGADILGRLRQAGLVVDERRFHDALSRHLRQGRFLLLAVGDGIHEGVESMADFLATQPHLGFTLRLLELALFRAAETEEDLILIQPRVIARTREVTRAIVEVIGDQVRVSTPPTNERGEPGGAPSRTSISEQQFIEKLAALGQPGIAEFAKWLVLEAPKHSLVIEWGKASMVPKYIEAASGEAFSFGILDSNGYLGNVSWLQEKCRRLELPEFIWRNYYDELSSLIPRAQHKTLKTNSGKVYNDVRVGDEIPEIRLLAPKRNEWLAAIDRAMKSIQSEMAKR